MSITSLPDNFLSGLSDRQRDAVTHIDGTGRVQTVTKEINPNFHLLIEKFYELSEKVDFI